VAADVERLRVANPNAPDAVPAELVAASPAGSTRIFRPRRALAAPRVAVRATSIQRVRSVIENQIEGARSASS